jgi:murein L,D-transpeptidase YafK
MLRNLLRPFILPLVLTAACFAPSAHAQQPLAHTAKADRILVVKSTHTMTLYAGGNVLKVYHVWLGRGPGNAKQKQGDNETPEGLYTINGRNAHSAAHLSLHISYPNAADRERARKLGADPGGDIMIHGLPPGNDWIKPGQQLADWTYGCIALTDAEMDEVWKLVPNGTPIEIRH